MATTSKLLNNARCCRTTWFIWNDNIIMISPPLRTICHSILLDLLIVSFHQLCWSTCCSCDVQHHAIWYRQWVRLETSKKVEARWDFYWKIQSCCFLFLRWVSKWFHYCIVPDTWVLYFFYWQDDIWSPYSLQASPIYRHSKYVRIYSTLSSQIAQF